MSHVKLHYVLKFKSNQRFLSSFFHFTQTFQQFSFLPPHQLCIPPSLFTLYPLRFSRLLFSVTHFRLKYCLRISPSSSDGYFYNFFVFLVEVLSFCTLHVSLLKFSKSYNVQINLTAWWFTKVVVTRAFIPMTCIWSQLNANVKVTPWTYEFSVEHHHNVVVFYELKK